MIDNIRDLNIGTNRIIAWSFRATWSAILTTAVLACVFVLAACSPISGAAAYNKRGLDFMSQKKYTEAIADFTEVIRLDPKNAMAYNNRGAYYSLQKYTEAIADFTEAIRLDPKYAEAYNDRGYAYLYQQKFAEAIADINEAIRLDPEYAAAYNMRGNYFLFQQKFTEAITDFTEAIRLDPKFAAGPYCNLGVVYTNTGDFTSAVSAFEQCVKLDTQSQYPWCKTALENAKLVTPTP